MLFFFFLPWICLVPFWTSNSFVINSIFLTRCVKQYILLVVFNLSAVMNLHSPSFHKEIKVKPREVTKRVLNCGIIIYNSCLIWAEWCKWYTVSLRYHTLIPFKNNSNKRNPQTPHRARSWAQTPAHKLSYHFPVSLIPHKVVAQTNRHYISQIMHVEVNICWGPFPRVWCDLPGLG